jgi:hypothetical protein
VTALPLAPVISSSSVPADRRRARTAAGRPLPLAGPVQSVPQEVVYGVARIDASGRICERAVLAPLGWARRRGLPPAAEHILPEPRRPMPETNFSLLTWEARTAQRMWGDGAEAK